LRRLRSRLAHGRGAIDEGFGPRIQTSEPEREPRVLPWRQRPKGDNAPLASEERLAPRERHLESEHDTLGSRLSARQAQRRPGQRLELAWKKLVCGGVGTRDANRDGDTCVVNHEHRIAAKRTGRRECDGTSSVSPERGQHWDGTSPALPERGQE